ncbi:SRPBCC family protein [Oceanobacillus sp. J11TS1]|uniref:SRPBCC family protein n=1 Tax=Oceanobacillus sp. J11TS1 TaxID=2807191 RepID=UPI001B11E3AA|nr:SRPBCC family protein [Oceanobacillus sp. J11TS1]GIO23357.1 activator of HSP90 ATPase [Oceanobacillus sp. J11TS1]
MITLNKVPEVKAEMLIRKPVQEVFEALVNPEITTKFWFTKSSGRLEQGKHIKWEWEMFGVSDTLYVKELQENEAILIEWPDGTEDKWIFTAKEGVGTVVTVINSGFTGEGDAIVSQAIGSMGGYTMVLCAMKALLEHRIRLNVVLDSNPAE